QKLHDVGATHIGIPCNTMHAPEIFDTLEDQMIKKNLDVKVINMVDEVISFINTNYANMEKIGILSTTGTFKKKIYYNALTNNGFKPVRPTEQIQSEIHDAIYNKEIGIKSQSSPITKRAKNTLVNGIRYLKDHGAEGVVLGCTEIAYAMPYKKLNDLPLFNTTKILARSLIHLTYPEKLKPVD
ncbi:MAG: aspartate/glutamate racemase family protein, partial [Bacteroidota bacterium]